MIKSMTGFASLTREDDAATIAVSVKTVNHRFLDVQVRALSYEPDAGSVHDLAAREVKARLRESSGAELLFAGSSGEYRWDHDAAAASA